MRLEPTHGLILVCIIAVLSVIQLLPSSNTSRERHADLPVQPVVAEPPLMAVAAK